MAVALKGNTPFVMEIDGTMNGIAFQVVGNGSGNAEEGSFKGKYVCTSGNLPLSFAALASTFGYGFKCFAEYPSNICNFFHQCFPEGYSQQRTIKFQSGGVITTVHTVTMKDNAVHNKVKLIAIDFPADSPVVTKNLQVMLPSTEYTYPLENGIRSLTHHVFPLISGDGFEVAEQITVNKPLGKRTVSLPAYHHLKSEIKQTDVQENSVEQHEVNKAYELKLI